MADAQIYWVLDLVVKSATINSPTFVISTPLWFIISADGLPQPFVTPPASVTSGPSWNYAARLLLSIPDITPCYLYVTMCTYGPGNQGVVQIARSRIGLRAMPRDTPQQFTFPLMRCQNGAQEIARLCLCAALSPVARRGRSYAGQAAAQAPQTRGFLSV
jgi:hypothetical protein